MTRRSRDATVADETGREMSYLNHDARRHTKMTKERSCEQALRHPLGGVLLGGGPDGEAERDLVDDIGDVVHHVERLVTHAAAQVPEEVAERVDGPTDGDDEAHGLEGGLHVLADLASRGGHLAGLTREDLEEDVEPSANAQDEADNGLHVAGLTSIAESQHGNGADEQAPEHARAKVGLHRREDEVELNHLPH